MSFTKLKLVMHVVDHSQQYSIMLLAVTNIAYGRDVAHMTVWWGFVRNSSHS